MKTFIVLCVVALAAFPQYGNSEVMKEEVPYVKVMATLMQEGIFEVTTSMYQKFPRDEDPEKVAVEVMASKLGEADISDLKAYFGRVETDCAGWMPSEDSMEVTDIIQMASTNGSVAEEKKKELEGANLFEAVGSKQFIVVFGGTNVCTALNVEEVKGIEKLKLIYSMTAPSDRDALIEVISSKLDVDKDAIRPGASGTSDTCAWIDVYFNVGFDDKDLLKKAYMTFGEKNSLGLFSPTETCMTDIRNSFVMEKIIMMFLKATEEGKDDSVMGPTKTCAGISTKLATEYKARLAKWDCMTKTYLKKYGDNFQGCLGDKMEGYEQEATQERSCNCSEYGSEAVKMYMDLMTISDYIGMSLTNPELAKKKSELAEQVKKPYPDMSKIEELSGKVKELQQAQDKTFWDINYGTCMVASRPDAWEKTESIKEKLHASTDIEGKADEILRELIMDSITYSLKMVMEKTQEDMFEMSAATLKIKLQVLMGINKGCSTESERKRVLESLMKIGDTIPGYLDKLAEMIGNENITMALDSVKSKIMEDAEGVAKKIFIMLYASAEPKEDDPMFESIMMLSKVIKEHAKDIAEKVKEFAQTETDNQKLMVLQVMLLTKDDLDRGCDYSGLAEKIRAMAKVDAPETLCAGERNNEQREESLGGDRRRSGRRFRRQGGILRYYDQPRREYGEMDEEEYYGWGE